MVCWDTRSPLVHFQHTLTARSYVDGILRLVVLPVLSRPARSPERLGLAWKQLKPSQNTGELTTQTLWHDLPWEVMGVCV
ncbi:hypothetical protein TNCV_2786371 [Trichonephila clavipes]|nr:hypothetical protein TNCV_2786371 [Trichonephila clavipes]